MEAILEQFLAKETARLGIRISSRQPIEARMRQLVWHICPSGTTEDEVTALLGLLQMRLEKHAAVQEPRMTTRSMVRK